MILLESLAIPLTYVDFPLFSIVLWMLNMLNLCMNTNWQLYVYFVITGHIIHLFIFTFLTSSQPVPPGGISGQS